MVFLDLEIPLVPTGYPPVGTMGMSPRNLHDKKFALPPKACVSNDALTGILYMQTSTVGLKTILITKIKVLMNVQMYDEAQ